MIFDHSPTEIEVNFGNNTPADSPGIGCKAYISYNLVLILGILIWGFRRIVLKNHYFLIVVKIHMNQIFTTN